MATLTLTITRTANSTPFADLEETLFESTSIDGFDIDQLKTQWTTESTITFDPAPWRFVSRSVDVPAGSVTTVFAIDLDANPTVTEETALADLRAVLQARAVANGTENLWLWKQQFNAATSTTVATTSVA